MLCVCMVGISTIVVWLGSLQVWYGWDLNKCGGMLVSHLDVFLFGFLFNSMGLGQHICNDIQTIPNTIPIFNAKLKIILLNAKWILNVLLMHDMAILLIQQ